MFLFLKFLAAVSTRDTMQNDRAILYVLRPWHCVEGWSTNSARYPPISQLEDSQMRKSIVVSFSAFALLAGVSMFTLMPSRDAAAQSGAIRVNAVDLDIAPEQMAAFITAIKENAAASVKEPGCREFNISVSTTDPNHVFLYEVYDNDAAVETHRATDHVKKYLATVANMITGRNARPLHAIALNSKAK
jgi:autoinducer 2-degrading protein